jgi:GH35 family endo-1,4-beta-xylanase
MKYIRIIILIVSLSFRLWANIDLVNAETNSVINTLTSSQTSIDLNDLGERAFNIKYSNSSSQITSVEFFINGNRASTDTDISDNTFYMYSNGEAWLPIAGTHLIEVKAFNNTGGLVSNDSHSIIFSEDLSHRMRKVYISTGVPNQEVSVSMKKHAYTFGSQTVESGDYLFQLAESAPADKPYPIRISGYGASSEQLEYINKYREVFLDNFNMTVAGNAMKWYSNGAQGIDFTESDRWLAWHEANNIQVRGHTLLWGRGKENEGGTREMHDQEWVEDLMEGNSTSLSNQVIGYMDPSWLEGLNTNNLSSEQQKELAKLAIKRRIQTIVTHYKGRIDEWDFNNELWNYDKYRKEFDGQSYSKSHTVQGDSILAEFAQWAVEANPNIRLYHNDYNIITGSNTNNSTSYRNLLMDLRDNHGVPVDGIGVQGHFGGTGINGRDKDFFTSCFDILDDLGVPIKVTELDVGGTGMSDTNRAQLLENVYRASFEHPAVEGVLMWGFWSGCHWRRDRAPWQYVGYEYNNTNTTNDQPANWTETEQVTRYRNLVFDEWWTESTVKTNEAGMIEMSVFAGDYDIIVDGVTFQKSISVSEANDPYYLAYSNGSLDETDGLFEITSPFENELFAPNERVVVNASFPDGSTSGVDYVEFYVNGDLYKRDSVAPFQMTFYDAPIGTHTLSISGQGLQAIEDSLNIEVADTILGTSLIGNSGFESGTATNGGLVTFGNNVNLNISSSIVHSGSNALFVERTSSDPSHDWHGIRYNLDELEIGETYQFSSKIYLINGNSANLRLKLKIVDPNDANNVSYPDIFAIDTPEIGTWIDLTKEFVYDGSQAFIYLSLSQSGDDYFVDDISLSKVSTSVNPDDSDNDGLSDTWEMNYLSSLDYGANEDTDNDGFSNILEYRSGTDPDNLGSFFKVLNSNFSHGGSQDTLQWLGHPSKQYRVLSKTDLSTSQWDIEEEAIDGSISTFNIWNGNHLGTPSKFYKVEIDD